MANDDLSVASLTSANDIIAQEENDRFTKHKPLMNLLILSVGPLLTTVGLSVLDSIDLIIISQRFKTEPGSMAIQIIGIGIFIVQICMYIGMFLAQALIVRLSALIGAGRREDASQLTVDIFRISLIFNFLSPVIVTFAARPIMNFAGCTPELIEQCMLLITASISAIPLCTFFHTTTGFLQGIGKPFLNGIYHLLANVLQTFVFTPFLQFVLKVNVTLCNFSQAFAQSFVGILLLILIFKGKFSLKPSWKMWFNRFSKETKTAIIMALPIIFTFIIGLLPQTFI